jgi:hypothetical protein
MSIRRLEVNSRIEILTTDLRTSHSHFPQSSTQPSNLSMSPSNQLLKMDLSSVIELKQRRQSDFRGVW